MNVKKSITTRSPERTVLRELFLRLHMRGQQWHLSNSPRTIANDIYKYASTHFRHIDERELEALLDRDVVDLIDQKAFIYLEPTNYGCWVVPVLTIRYAPGESPPELRLRLAL